MCEGLLQLRQAGATLHRGAGATLHRGARASHQRGPSHCGAQAPDAQAQQLWLTGPAAPRHVGSSQTRVRTHVPCTSRQTPNHCATREAPPFFLNMSVVGHLGCFHVLAIVNSAAMNIGVHVSFQIRVFKWFLL